MSEVTTWPGWKVVRLIGKGSFGAVYEIERDVFGTTEKAALKIISIPQSDSDVDDLLSDGYDHAGITQRYESYLKDIVREYSLMAEMKGNSNIVDCDDLQYTEHKDGFGWDISIKMELLTPLTKALGKEITEQQTIQLGIDICNALIICKKRNIVHRDIKPQNIFVSKHGQYKLGDFGIAKIADRTTTGTKTGTFKYMAPEVYNNQPYGTAADIYSLGIVLYWMLNERRTPFLPLPPEVPTAFAEEDARQRRFRGDRIPAPAHGSEELAGIVLKACAFNTEERYSDPAQMLDDLLRLKAAAEETVYVPQKPVERPVQQSVERPKAPNPAPAYAAPVQQSAERPKAPNPAPAYAAPVQQSAERPKAPNPAPAYAAPVQRSAERPIVQNAAPPYAALVQQSAERPRVQNAAPPYAAPVQQSAEGPKAENAPPKGGRGYDGSRDASAPQTQKAASKPEKAGAQGRKLPKWVIPGGAALLALIIGLVLILTLGKGGNDQAAAVPSERIMASDAATVLKNNGLSDSVVDLEVKKADKNDQYATYTAYCDVTGFADSKETTYSVVLVYELNDGEWELSSLSRMQSE